MNRLPDLETARKKQQMGFLVHPDPSDPAVQKAYAERTCPNFYMYGRLPMWDEDFFRDRLVALRKLGLQNVYFKMAGYDVADMERVLRIAAENKVDMVTFDGASGGSGYSPCAMMNEWCQPTVVMEANLVKILEKLKGEYDVLPAVNVTGGFAGEGDVFKALALGDGNITAIGLCRAAMAAAMNADAVGKLIASGNVPAHLQKYGKTVQEIFADLPQNIDVVFLPINGVGNNMNMVDAAAFAKKIGAKVVVPVHVGMFDEIDPATFPLENKVVPQLYKEIAL